jgi:tricorn protease
MQGYYRHPTVHHDTVVFVCEDDLWSVPLDGGTARRLTANLSMASMPAISPDGQLLAFIGSEEGPLDLYVMPAVGGEATRLTYQSALPRRPIWTPAGNDILYSSDAIEAFWRKRWLWSIPVTGGNPTRLLQYGVASEISFGPRKAVVLGRHTGDSWRWKRYRGGTIGSFWVDTTGNAKYFELVPTDGNLADPMWIGKRIYFLSDHEGIANLYSCTPRGQDLRRHTHHDDFYCRAARTDSKHIVYHAGADIFAFDVQEETTWKVAIELHSPRTQRRRRFVSPARYLQDVALRPDANALALITRGKFFTMGNWEGPALQHGEREGVRYRLAQWLPDQKHLVVVSDADGEEAIEVHRDVAGTRVHRIKGIDIGRPTGLIVSPMDDQVVLRNHRFELIHINLKTEKMRVLDKSRHSPIFGMAWSPDGRWIAYSLATTERTHSIKLCRLSTGKTYHVTPPEFRDIAPAWDPQGNYLYFLSYREFNPVYDELHFDLGFPKAMRPMLVLLQEDLPNPFMPRPIPVDGEHEEKKNGKKAPRLPRGIPIDLKNISHRVLALPVPEGRYGQIAGVENKAIYTAFPVVGTIAPRRRFDSGESTGTLLAFDFKEQKQETLITDIHSFVLNHEANVMAYRVRDRVRVIKSGEKPRERDKDKSEGTSRQSGWIDLDRMKVSLMPPAEWRQMFREAWRLQRDYFWNEEMSGVDWRAVYRQYLPLLDRVGSRGEFSDLVWEMQGELGTSHCYEIGGDYRRGPLYAQGYLGADFDYDDKAGGYRITYLPHGDSWEATQSPPVHRPGAYLREGDLVLAVNGQRLSRDCAPSQLLVQMANTELELLVRFKGSTRSRTVTVKPLSNETMLRYRDWVRRNRDYVHQQTNDQVGYVHIPNMTGWGYAEFHRGWLTELYHPGLIIDVRYNGGGHVSPLILEKLARRRIGYDVRRWGEPEPYPSESVLGPLVALTNECAGSDGDIFSHSFKLMKLGPLIGTRTWGGVIGISPQSAFVDGGHTTQPGYSFWFEDVGWRIENYGTEPDIEVDIAPQDYAVDRDPQLDRAIAEITKQLKVAPPAIPDFGPPPKLNVPKLPPRP